MVSLCTKTIILFYRSCFLFVCFVCLLLLLLLLFFFGGGGENRVFCMCHFSWNDLGNKKIKIIHSINYCIGPECELYFLLYSSSSVFPIDSLLSSASPTINPADQPLASSAHTSSSTGETHSLLYL